MRTSEPRTPRRTVLIALLVAVLIPLLLTVGPGALAQSAGTISGTVLNGTTDEPVPGIEVRVQLFSTQADLGTLTTRTDANGRFAFADLPAGVAGYQLAATYRRAEYRSVTTTFTPGAPNEQTLRVFEPTSDATPVSLTDYVVWVDREQGGVAVQHDLAWENVGDAAYVGDGRTVVRIPLPEGASNLRFLGTFLEYGGAMRDGAYVSDAPIVPGRSSATLRYNAPPLDRLTLVMAFPTRSLQLFVPRDVQVRAPALRLSGTVSDQGLTYSVYEARDLAAGTSIDVQMSQAASAASGARAATWILLAALGLLVVVGVAVALVRRGRSGRRPRSSTTAPRRKARAAVRAAGDTAQGNGKAVEAEDPDLIIEEIAALDLSFERGLIEERAYKRLRVAAKDRLLRAEAARARGGRARAPRR